MLTAASFSASGLHIAVLGLIQYVYRYICYSVCVQGCKSPCIHVFSLATVFVAHIHTFAALIYMFTCLLGAAYMEMYVLLDIRIIEE